MLTTALAPAAPSPAGAPSDAAAAVRDDVGTIAAAIGRLTTCTEDVATWSPVDRRDLLGRLDRAVDALAAVRARVLLAERESGAWQGGGDRSFASWRSRTARSGERAASAQVRQAEHLAALPSVAAAVTEGRISLEHATVIGRVASTGSPAQRAEVARPTAQAALLRLAEDQDAGTFATTVARWAAGLDPAGLERDHQAQRAARFLYLTHTPRGTLIRGQVDSMTGHRIGLALEAVTTRPPADDDRDPGQRRADALDTMARRILTDTDTKPGAHVPPHVSLILTDRTWHAARRESERRRAGEGHGGAPAGRGDGRCGGRSGGRGDGVSVGGIDGADGEGGVREPALRAGVSAAASGGARGRGDGASEPATLEDDTPVPPSELAAALCDCDITRIAIDADGAPMDLGRTQRLFTGPQRRAVIAHDRECAWPSCSAPARYCEIHHLDWWERDGGRTAVHRGVLLCAFHHHEVHRRDLTVTRVTGTPARGRRAGPAGSVLAQARYTFRDPAGRPIGEPVRPGAGAGPPEVTSPAATPTCAGAPSNRPPTVGSQLKPPGSLPGGDGTGESSRSADGARRSQPSRAGPSRSGATGDGPPGARDRIGTGRSWPFRDLPPPDELPLEWTTDPMTGARVPTLLLRL